MTPEELDAIEARATAATPAPWRCIPRDVKYYPHHDSSKPVEEWDPTPVISQAMAIADDNTFLGADVDGPVEPGRSAFVVPDAWFIANAREDVPALVVECRRLRSALGAVLDATDYTRGGCRPTELVGAVLPTELIRLAREALR